MAVAWIVLIFPTALLLAGAIRFRETEMPITPPQWAERAALIGILLSAYSVVKVIVSGPATTPIIGIGNLGFSVLLDPVSIIFLLLISILAWVILRFSATHLQGETREGAFTFWICFILAGITFLITSGNLVQLGLGWVGTTIGVKRLLIFYVDRPGAQRAARKNTIFARTADIMLVAGLLLLYRVYGLFDIASINDVARAGFVPPSAILAAACLTIAAVLQCALLPVQGWLTEAIEAPTPFSALLHTCVVSTGSFLIIRFADVMLGAPLILATLIVMGGFSALVGSIVMLTQSATKTALAWSTVSQMGFVMLLCGLGLFALALLHTIAHAFYKTHAILIAAEECEGISAVRKLSPIASPSARNVALAIGLSITVYTIIGLPFGIMEKSPQAVAVGAILVIGVGYLVSQGLTDAAPRELGISTARASVLFATTFFSLQWVAWILTAVTLPPTPQAGPLEWMLIILLLSSFTVVVILQALLPLWTDHPAFYGIRVHVTNGLYLNAQADRIVGAWKTKTQAKDT